MQIFILGYLRIKLRMQTFYFTKLRIGIKVAVAVFSLGQLSSFSCAHLRTLQVVVAKMEHGAYLINTIIFIYKLRQGRYTKVD